MKRLALFLCLALILGGCATFDLDGGRERLTTTAAAEGWKTNIISSTPFPLYSMFSPNQIKGHPLTVYIEGDGNAWLDRFTASPDPTPIRPVALRLALADAAPNVVYLGRPCQYAGLARSTLCHPRYWTTHRLSAEVVRATNSAIDIAKNRIGALQLVLVGHSGGGSLAALIANSRRDVALLVTVSANLDTDMWADDLGVTRMFGSLNPATVDGPLSQVNQVHLAGADDTNVRPDIIRSFLRKRNLQVKKMTIVEGYDHDCCWHKDWAARTRSIRRSVGKLSSAHGR